MNVHVNTIEAFLEAMVAELEIPEHRYDQADRSFKSFGEWLHRPPEHRAPVRPSGLLPRVLSAWNGDPAADRRRGI
jgi:hypothetical protein